MLKTMPPLPSCGNPNHEHPDPTPTPIGVPYPPLDIRRFVHAFTTFIASDRDIQKRLLANFSRLVMHRTPTMPTTYISFLCVLTSFSPKSKRGVWLRNQSRCRSPLLPGMLFRDILILIMHSLSLHLGICLLDNHHSSIVPVCIHKFYYSGLYPRCEEIARLGS